MRPSITVHYAQSLDGRIATTTGASRWLSGPETLRFAHSLRASADAILVGSGTAIADDPRLTVRQDESGPAEAPAPLRVVLDGRGRLHRSANLLRDPAAKTLYVTRNAPADESPSHAPLAPHVELCRLPPDRNGSGIDLRVLLESLRARGIAELLVEGGRSLLTSFFRDDLVDKLFITIAPIVIGTGIDAVGDLGVASLDQAKPFVLRRVHHLGKDALLELTRDDR